MMREFQSPFSGISVGLRIFSYGRMPSEETAWGLNANDMGL